MKVLRDHERADPLRQQLLGPKRNQLLSRDEVLVAGQVFFGDPQGLAYYGMPPDEWYQLGVRILGRTCVEATPDVTASAVGRTAKDVIGAADGVVDLFAGSGNLLLHVARALAAPAVGMEADAAVWSRTVANLELVGAREISVRHGDWASYFDTPLAGHTMVYVLSPPWGEAFSFVNGLDLARTSPPIPFLLNEIAARDRAERCLAVIQHTPTEPVFNLPPVELAGSGPGCLIVKLR